MLPDLSPTHIIIFVVLALVVVGPKDLPGLLRKTGQFMGRLRGMANEFRASFDEMARQSELDELRKEVEAMRAAAAKPVGDLKDQVSGLIEQSTVSLDDHTDVTTIAPVADEAEASILPPKTKRAGKAGSAKAAKSASTKSVAKYKAPAKSAVAKPATSKAKPKSKPKAAPPSEPGQ